MVRLTVLYVCGLAARARPLRSTARCGWCPGVGPRPRSWLWTGTGRAPLRRCSRGLWRRRDDFTGKETPPKVKRSLWWWHEAQSEGDWAVVWVKRGKMNKNLVQFLLITFNVKTLRTFKLRLRSTEHRNLLTNIQITSSPLKKSFYVSLKSLIFQNATVRLLILMQVKSRPSLWIINAGQGSSSNGIIHEHRKGGELTQLRS